MRERRGVAGLVVLAFLAGDLRAVAVVRVDISKVRRRRWWLRA